MHQKQVPQKGSEDKEVVKSKESQVKKSKSDSVRILNEKQNEGNHHYECLVNIVFIVVTSVLNVSTFNGQVQSLGSFFPS